MTMKPLNKLCNLSYKHACNYQRKKQTRKTCKDIYSSHCHLHKYYYNHDGNLYMYYQKPYTLNVHLNINIMPSDKTFSMTIWQILYQIHENEIDILSYMYISMNVKYKFS
jgi:hypothetical protein